MPVNAFNGTHNWGYDGVGWFAVHEQYGGPDAYRRFARGLALERLEAELRTHADAPNPVG